MKQLSKLPLRLGQSAWRVLLVGLILRLLLMPISAHSDLMQIYWNAHLITFHHKLVGFQVVLQYFHAGYLWLISSLLPPASTIWIHLVETPLVNAFAGAEVSFNETWFNFISHPQIFRTLFLFKLPYLLFDLGCAFLLFRIGSDSANSRWMFKFWWFNPILIFAVYIFGRHEVIALIFIILSLYLIKREKHGWGMLALGLAIAIRFYAVLILPFFVFSLQPEWKKRVLGLTIGLSPWLIVNLVGWALASTSEARVLASLPHSSYLLAMDFQIAAWDNIYVFPLLYFLLLLHRLYNQEYGVKSLVQYSLIALLFLFATAYTGQSPHYWTWFLPLLTLMAAEDHHLLPLHVAQILCLVIYSFVGGRSTASYLFAAISPEFFWSLPSPVDILERFTSPEVTISLFRTAFSAITFWMAYLVFRRIKVTFLMDKHAKGEL
jgi:hypothetical protein